MRYNYNKNEIDLLLDNMVILVDTREKKNQHITSVWDKQGIKYKSMKLDQADYSVMIESNEETAALGVTRDLYFDDVILIETKRNLDEIAGNLINREESKNRERLEREFLRVNKIGAKLFLIVENEQGMSDLVAGNYRSQYNSKAFIRSLLQYQARYNLHLEFVNPNLTAFIIYNKILCHVREHLRGR